MGIQYTILLIFVLVLDIVLVIYVLNINMKYKRLERKYRLFMKGEDGISLERELNRKLKRIEKYAKNTNSIDAEIENLKTNQKHSLHKYGVVKYDAFEDVGGKLSFALALLDDYDSGFVLNAVHSKENCFLYIKEIVRGESYIMLSNEEIEALRIAKQYGAENQLPVQ